MQSTEIRFVVLFLFLFNADAKPHECAEFHNETLGRLVKRDSERFHDLKKQIEELFDAFDSNDEERLEEIYHDLEQKHIHDEDEVEEESEYKSKIIKYVPDRIKSENYPAEVHKVRTKDGYELELHRIPYGIKSPKSDGPKPVVFLMHGFLDSSNGYVVLGPEHSIAYLLADAGYDVWMGNSRGTEPSRKHKHLNPNGLFNKKYWSFSWHEIGVLDLPAFIDFILNETKQTKLNYVGFSQGTTAFFVLTSMRPEYNDKIIEAQLMAPVALMENTENSLYKGIAHYYKQLKRLIALFGINKITVNNKLITKIVEWACDNFAKTTSYSCKLVLSVFDSQQINCTVLPFIVVNTPAGASVRQGIHYIQSVRNGGFRQFDYENVKLNREKYGNDTPPSYDLEKITVPVNLYHAKEDTSASYDNVIKLKSLLPNVKSTHLVPIADFIHVDFIYSRYVREAVNDKLIENINAVNGK